MEATVKRRAFRRCILRWLGLCAFGILLTLSAGCTSLRDYVHNGFKVGPNYRRPPAPVANDWIDSTDKRVVKDCSEQILVHWWTTLNDPVLDALVADAYRQNLTLREAGFRILQARAMWGISVGNIFPQQQYMFGDYKRYALSGDIANAQFAPSRFFPQWNFGFSLAWELDFWGRFRRAVEAARGELDASVEDYDGALVTLLGDVAQTYVVIRTLEEQIALTTANVQLQKQTLVLATARFRGGMVTELDVEQAQSILSQTQAQIPALEINLRQANDRLCVLLGIPMENLQARMGKRPIPTAPADVVVGIPADLLRRRPDVRRAERLAAAQAARIGIAESDFYPQISLSGTLAYSAQKFKDAFSSNALTGSFGPAFQWNLLNYGRILNQVRVEDAQFQELAVAYQNSVLKANQEVEDGLAMFLQSQLQTRYMAESVTAADRSVVIAVAQYKGGLVDFNRVSLLEQNLVQQQNLYAQSYGAIALGLVQTYRALGGGWQIRLDPAADCAPGLPPPGAPAGAEDVRTPASVPAPIPPGALPNTITPSGTLGPMPPGADPKNLPPPTGLVQPNALPQGMQTPPALRSAPFENQRPVAPQDVLPSPPHTAPPSTAPSAPMNPPAGTSTNAQPGGSQIQNSAAPRNTPFGQSLGMPISGFQQNGSQQNGGPAIVLPPVGGDSTDPPVNIVPASAIPMHPPGMPPIQMPNQAVPDPAQPSAQLQRAREALLC